MIYRDGRHRVESGRQSRTETGSNVRNSCRGHRETCEGATLTPDVKKTVSAGGISDFNSYYYCERPL